MTIFIHQLLTQYYFCDKIRVVLKEKPLLVKNQLLRPIFQWMKKKL